MSTPSPQEMTLDAIRSVPLFASLHDEAASDLRNLLRVRDVPGGAPLFRAGDVGDAMYLIESGRVRITIRDEDHKEIVLAELAQGARVGTSSLRRAAQLRSVRPDLEIENIRGNVDTRLRKLDEKQYDAIVLASAGLRRLGWENRITELLDPSVMCPAVGQGALAVETRADGGQAQEISKRLDHRETRIAVTGERAVLAALGGGCQVPIGAYATVEHDRIHLQAVIVSPDGSEVIGLKASGAAADAATIGRALGNQLLAEGGRQILEAVYGAEADAKLRS